ncbi:MAG: acyltransferase family protein [Synergistaceae bacterium]|nr:acyltransferase family protein [Synergistaceae bacterium]
MRVAGAFAVMVLHVAAQNWYSTDVRSLAWQTFNFYDGLVRLGVPLFVMISGALFLSRDIPVKKLYSKYIFKIFTAFVFWSLVYAAWDYAKSGKLLWSLSRFISGHYHMWFLFMIVGLYMIVPFMKKIAESASLTKYFLVLVLVFTFVLPESANVVSLFSEKYGGFINKVAGSFNMRFVMGFSGYFLLGYFLDNADITAKAERLIYTAGILGAAATVLMSLYASLLTGKPDETFYGSMSVNVLCETVAVFVFFKKHLDQESALAMRLSQYSLGAYLVHDANIMLIRRLGLDTLTFCPVLAVPVIAVMVFVLSFAISAVIHRIPILKKYVV